MALQPGGWSPFLDIYVTDLTGHIVHTIWEDNPRDWRDDGGLWSPDGKRIAWRHNFTRSAHKVPEYYGVGMARLQGDGTWKAEVQPDEKTFVTPLAWSPDGQRLLCARIHETGASLFFTNDRFQTVQAAFDLDSWDLAYITKGWGRKADWAILPEDLRANLLDSSGAAQAAWPPDSPVGRPGAPPAAIAPFDEKKAKEHQEAWAKHLGVPVEVTNSIGMKFVLIPPGEFTMGSPEGELQSDTRPRHRVRISKAFYLGKHLVTQEQWQAIVSQNPSNFQGPENPVENVSWDDCHYFLDRLNKRFAEKDGKCCLPTEAQWEYACRAGTTTRYYCGDSDLGLADYAWYSDNSDRKPHPVGLRKPSAWGLYDMQGNVWEWCEDWYEDGYYAKSPLVDPPGPSSGAIRVMRGGHLARERCLLQLRDPLRPGPHLPLPQPRFSGGFGEMIELIKREEIEHAQLEDESDIWLTPADCPRLAVCVAQDAAR
jgi:formylglycine-generating enzyme required for sulfatase activity